MIQPVAPSPPLEGAALLKFLQNWITPLTGLTGDLVRPRWQPEPANIPDVGTVWMAFGIVSRRFDTFPVVVSSSDLETQLTRQEELRLLCSVYDLGSTGEADRVTSLLRDNLAVYQNLEPLLAAGFMLAYVEEETVAPVYLSTQGLYRLDLPVVVRRAVQRTYSVPSILVAVGTIHTDVGLADVPIQTPLP